MAIGHSSQPPMKQFAANRDEQRLAAEFESLLRAYIGRHEDAPTDRIEAAFELAKTAHVGQYRKSGEAYIHHPVAVAGIVASLGLDAVTISAALVHDSVEDTDVTLAEVEEQLGLETARIVDGVTKLERVKFDSKEHQQAATMRKMMVAVAQDLRVLIIKLCDRLHNMRTIASMPAFKQERASRETIDIYAPLAHRLGMNDLKTQLEDLSFAAMHPKRYAEIDHLVSKRDPERDILLAQVIGDVETRLTELGIDADVTGRPKHLYSIYEKMQVKGRSFDEIYDLVGIRVVVRTVRDCYAALGSIHATWKPVQGRFKDFIAMPKFNLYQSLHTTVIGPQGKPLEVQIRTQEMHDRAEGGVAAHWDYKDKSNDGDMAWLSRIVDWQEETEDPDRFMANLKVDLDHEEVFVFTPAGRVITLPVGATTVDFAYAIHSEVGDSCVGARINGKLVPLDSRLNSGDAVEIFTSKVPDAGPSRDWLKFVVTHRALNRIRHWHSREQREDAIEQGRSELAAGLRSVGLPVKKFFRPDAIAELAGELNYASAEALFAAVGTNNVDASAIVGRITRALQDGDKERRVKLPTNLSNRGVERRASTGSGVHVEGLDDVMIRLSKCCSPVPPDAIMGFVTRGRGVSVHRSDCANAQELIAGHAERLIDVDWTSDHAGQFVTSIEVQSLDRAHLLADIARVVADNNLNILSADTDTGRDRVSRMRFEIELGDVSHLQRLLSQIRDIDNVYDAYRVVPGRGRLAAETQTGTDNPNLP